MRTASPFGERRCRENKSIYYGESTTFSRASPSATGRALPQLILAVPPTL